MHEIKVSFTQEFPIEKREIISNWCGHIQALGLKDRPTSAILATKHFGYPPTNTSDLGGLISNAWKRMKGTVGTALHDIHVSTTVASNCTKININHHNQSVSLRADQSKHAKRKKAPSKLLQGLVKKA